MFFAKYLARRFGLKIKEEEQAKENGKIYIVQVGAFSVKSNAEKLAKKLEEEGFSTLIKEKKVDGKNKK